MSGGSESSQTSTPMNTVYGGATGDTGYGTSTGVFNTALGLSNTGPTLKDIGDFSSYSTAQDPSQGWYSTSLQDALSNPGNQQVSSAQQSILNNVMDQTSARGATSGFGAPTQSALATSIAPTLNDFYNTYVSSLLSGYNNQESQYNTDVNQASTTRGQDITQNAQTSADWQAQLQSLLELVGLAMPQVVSSTDTQGTSNSDDIITSWIKGLTS